jgi:hypothetical protein
MKRPVAWPDPRNPTSRWSHQNVSPEPRQIGHHDAASSPGHRVPEHQLGFPYLRLVSDPIGIVSQQLFETAPSDLRAETTRII